jgi:hypothetical protein
MRVVQWSVRRSRRALPCRRVAHPQLAHHEEASFFLFVHEHEAATGRVLLTEGEEVPGGVHQQPDSRISLAARCA